MRDAYGRGYEDAVRHSVEIIAEAIAQAREFERTPSADHALANAMARINRLHPPAPRGDLVTFSPVAPRTLMIASAILAIPGRIVRAINPLRPAGRES